MGFFNSKKNRTSSSIAISRRGKMRSPQAQNRRIIQNMRRDNYNTTASSTVQQPRYKQRYSKQVTQEPKSRLDIMNDLLVSTNENVRSEIMQFDFLEYSLLNADIMIVLNIEDILREYELEQGYLTNNVFDNIQCEKVGIVYSPKKKMFLYIAFNSYTSTTCHIIFKSKNLNELPNIDRIDLKLLPIDSNLVENANRLMVSSFDQVFDLCHNPILGYGINEIFRK